MSRFLASRAPLAIAAALALLALATGTARASRDEYAVKAAFLSNFARLVQWPVPARPAETEPLVISVLGSEEALRAITQGVADARIGSHGLSVQEIRAAGDLPGSHIVFVGRDYTKDLDALLAAAREHAVLTVGESPDFARRGGVINFFTADKKVRFEINPGAARRAGLEVSARLLRLAVLVEDGD